MNPLGNIKHGGAGTLTYRRWKSMRQRTSGGASSPQHYRGIQCCTRWESFADFLYDMGECPPGHTLDRIDNALGYQPGNCRWATKIEQSENRSTTVHLTMGGRTMSVAAWGRHLGIAANTIRQRLYLGWSVDRALTEPVGLNGGARGISASSHSHGHHDRTRIANVLRDRGHVIAGDITKVFRRATK